MELDDGAYALICAIVVGSRPHAWSMIYSALIPKIL